jgi:hydroxymethylpyrimidine pyrophosphatase-like HAD family hydrolase
MTPVILADLDDTIFTTLKNYAGVDPETLRQVTVAKNGNHSFMCKKRDSLLAWMAMGATFIPVTARSADAFDRVSLNVDCAGAVLSNGALILDTAMAEDHVWSRRVADHCYAARDGLEQTCRAIADHGHDVRIHRHMHGDVMLGMTVKSNDETPDGVLRLLDITESLRDGVVGDHVQSFACHRNGNNLAFVPNGVSKKNAVMYLLETRADLAGRPTIGAGDSRSDLPFMGLCDMMLVPAATQASDKLFA